MSLSLSLPLSLALALSLTHTHTPGGGGALGRVIDRARGAVVPSADRPLPLRVLPAQDTAATGETPARGIPGSRVGIERG